MYLYIHIFIDPSIICLLEAILSCMIDERGAERANNDVQKTSERITRE